MFNLTAEELDCAKDAIDHHGYSTMLPRPVEWQDLTDRWSTIRYRLSNIDLERYRPTRPIVITAAKSEESTRVLHLLHPCDMLLYTSLTLLLKDDIEATRIPTANQRVYSYRASSRGDRLYRTTRKMHDDYIERLKHSAARKKTKFVGVTDIANFYASISQKKIHDLLLDAASTEKNRIAAHLLVSTFADRLMTHRGRGIPTGPYASRILAEILLHDIDRYLVSKEVDFVRWVDDFNFFTRSFAASQRTILGLSRWLYEEHDLILQSAKTHVLDVKEYSSRLLLDLEDKLSGRTEILTLLLKYDVEESLDDVDDVMDDLHAMELLEMLVDALAKSERVDYRVVDFAVRRLQRINLDRQIEEELLDILVENLQSLVPIIENVAKLMSCLCPRRKRRRQRIARRLLRSIDDIGAIDHYAVWILTIFVRDQRWGCVNELIDVFRRAESNAIRRYAALAVDKAGYGEALQVSSDSMKGGRPEWRW